MTPAGAEALGSRLGHEMVVGYTERKRFEAGLLAGSMWGRGKKKEPENTIEAASDEDLSGFGIGITDKGG